MGALHGFHALTLLTLTTRLGAAPRRRVVHHVRKLAANVVVMVAQFDMGLGIHVAATQSEIEMHFSLRCLSVAVA